MNLSDQVTSLEVSRRLKEIGAKQDSYFWHCTNKDKSFICGEERLSYEPVVQSANNLVCENLWRVAKLGEYELSEKVCSAYTVAELLHILPKSIKNNDGCDALMIIKYINDDDTMGAGYFKCLAWQEGFTHVADGLGKLLIYLLENNLVSLEEINKKL